MGCRGLGCGDDDAGYVGGCVRPGARKVPRRGAGCPPHRGGGAADCGRDGCGGDAGPCSPRMLLAAAAVVGRAEAEGGRELSLQSGPPLRPLGSGLASVGLSVGGTRCSASSTAPPGGSSALWD